MTLMNGDVETMLSRLRMFELIEKVSAISCNR